MTSTRFLLPGFLLVAWAGPALAQPGAPGSRYDLFPSVLPAGGEEPGYPTRPQVPPPTAGPPAVDSLGQMSAPGGGAARPADPVGTLTGQPQQPPPAAYPEYGPGTYPSPYYVDGPGCCGPMERAGRIGYDLYSFSGVNFVFGSGLPHYLYTGYDLGASVRTLFFDATHTAAWTVDLGGSFTHNFGVESKDPQNLYVRQPASVNSTTNVVTPQPDLLVFAGIHAIDRSSFNYNLGRDWWLWGSGNTGGEQGPNLRVGGWIGGRYGTSHVDVILLNQVNGYARRQNAFEGINFGAHMSYEVPMGSWILFGGIRAEYGYDWTNLVPPIQGNLQNINVQFTAGIRF
jgi:hypothetical protein